MPGRSRPIAERAYQLFMATRIAAAARAVNSGVAGPGARAATRPSGVAASFACKREPAGKRAVAPSDACELEAAEEREDRGREEHGHLDRQVVSRVGHQHEPRSRKSA